MVELQLDHPSLFPVTMIYNILHLDYETRARVNLFAEGAYRYACDPGTECVSMAWGWDEGDVELWVPAEEPFPQEVKDFMLAGIPRSLHAHNAQFERLITEHVLGIPTDIDQWYCTAAQARARALPGGLDDLGRCLALPIQKDQAGKDLIKKICIPPFDDDPELLERFYDYNMTDVITERMSENASVALDDNEQRVWIANEKVNDAGLKVDVAFAKAAANYAEQELREISEELTSLTNGVITRPRQFARLKQFIEPIALNDKAVRDAITREVTDRRTGDTTTKTTLDSNARTKLLDLERQKPGCLGPNVREVIELLDAAGRSSVSKFEAMVNRADEDGRVRGAYIFSGAGQTGRFSSAGLQVHNFPRSTAAEFEATRAKIMAGEPIDDAMTVLASMLRGSIIAEDGHQFVCGDWSGIESRVLPWLTKDADAKPVLKVFRDMDRDPSLPDNYMKAAADIYNKPAKTINKTERAVGKVVVLACGYAGGAGAFNSMARAYGVTMSDELVAETIRKWRRANPWATRFWTDLNNAAIDAVANKGTIKTVGRLDFFCGEYGLLTMVLPSGRIICYPQARLTEVETPNGGETELSAIKANWRPKEGESEWPRIRLYGGLIAENATQACAADILREALVDLTELDWPVVGHVHDELLLEVADDEVAEATDQLRRAMMTPPAWADGLPLNCEIWTGRRYRK